MSRDVVIVGGGVAGSAAACLIARAGGEVRLVERDMAPRHKICGEFLSSEAQAYLAALGLDLPAMGAAVVTHLRLSHRRQQVTQQLPFQGLGLSRRRLDAALLDLAAESGAVVMRGRSVREITPGPVSDLRLDDGAELAAPTLFVASGKHELRGTARDVDAGNDLIGLKSYFRLRLPQQQKLRHHVEVALFRGGYAGLQLVEEDLANLCLLVSRERFAAIGNDWPALLADLMAENRHLAERLDGAADQLPKPLAIAHVPYGFLHCARPLDPDGVFRLGDQLAVTPSFSGDGVSIALHSAFGAADAWQDGVGAFAYHQRMAREIGPQVRRAVMLSSLLMNSFGQSLTLAVAKAMPSLLSRAASLTRLPLRQQAVSLPVTKQSRSASSTSLLRSADGRKR